MCDIIPKTSEDCAPPNGAPGVVWRDMGTSVIHCLLLQGSIKEGRTPTAPKRQSVLNYKSLQTALCARCGVMRRHLSCLSPVWGQRAWKPSELHIDAIPDPEEMESKHPRVCCLLCQDILNFFWLWFLTRSCGCKGASTVFFFHPSLPALTKRHRRACCTLGEQILRTFCASLMRRRRWCLHWTPFSRRWWISLGFPTWKRSIQLISDCNCTPVKAQWHLVGSLQHLPLDSKVWRDAWLHARVRWIEVCENAPGCGYLRLFLI